MLFQFSAVELGRFEDLLYWLRRAGFAVDVHYSKEDATIDAVRGTVVIRVVFRRYGMKLQVAGQISRPNSSVIEVTRLQPVITYAKSVLNIAEDED